MLITYTSKLQQLAKKWGCLRVNTMTHIVARVFVKFLAILSNDGLSNLAKLNSVVKEYGKLLFAVL